MAASRTRPSPSTCSPISSCQGRSKVDPSAPVRLAAALRRPRDPRQLSIHRPAATSGIVSSGPHPASVRSKAARLLAGVQTV
jgi:hypothetical protein